MLIDMGRSLALPSAFRGLKAIDANPTLMFDLLSLLLCIGYRKDSLSFSMPGILRCMNSAGVRVAWH